jgi:hypothetical protein
MAYDWRPTATRTATTDPGLVTTPGPVATASAPPPASAPPTPFDDIRVAAAVDEFLRAAADGQALNRSGRPYRPSAFRDLRGCLTHHVVPHLGDLRLDDVRRRHLQALVDELAVDGLSISRIRSIISATRALYGYAIEQGYVEFSPADGLVVPPEAEPTGSGPRVSGVREPESAWGWSDTADLGWEEPPATRSRPRRRPQAAPRPAPPPRHREGGELQPLALLPERILSLILRIVVVLFVLIALVTIAESA